jgi:hypothetical protein
MRSTAPPRGEFELVRFESIVVHPAIPKLQSFPFCPIGHFHGTSRVLPRFQEQQCQAFIRAICLVRKMAGAISEVYWYERVGDSFQLRKRCIVRDVEVERKDSEDRLEPDHGNDLRVQKSKAISVDHDGHATRFTSFMHSTAFSILKPETQSPGRSVEFGGSFKSEG